MNLQEHIRKVLKEETDGGFDKNPEKYVKLLELLLEPYKNDNGICDIKVSYDFGNVRFLDQGAYIIRIEFGIKDVKEITGSIFPNVHIDKIRHQIENKITNFLPINNLYVGTSLTPECGKNRWWNDDNN
jgi:hypothetical protein